MESETPDLPERIECDQMMKRGLSREDIATLVNVFYEAQEQLTLEESIEFIEEIAHNPEKLSLRAFCAKWRVDCPEVILEEADRNQPSR